MGLGSSGAGDCGAGEGSKRASVHGQILASQCLQPVGGCEEVQQVGGGGDQAGVGLVLLLGLPVTRYVGYVQS